MGKYLRLCAQHALKRKKHEKAVTYFRKIHELIVVHRKAQRNPNPCFCQLRNQKVAETNLSLAKNSTLSRRRHQLTVDLDRGRKSNDVRLLECHIFMGSAVNH